MMSKLLRLACRDLAHLLRVNAGFIIYAAALFAIFFATSARAAALNDTGACLPPGVTSWCNEPYGCYYGSPDEAAQAAFANSTAYQQGGTIENYPGWGQHCPASGYGYRMSVNKSGVTRPYTNICPTPTYTSSVDPKASGASDLNGANTHNACSTPATTSEECEALEEQTSGPGNDSLQTWSGTFPQCKGGCSFGPQGATTSVTFGGQTIVTGDFGFSGLTCAPTPTSPPPAAKPEDPVDAVCVAAGAGQSYCTKQNGDRCYTAGSTGKQICWGNGETGTKTEQNVAQVRKPGTATPAAPTPPPGETFTQTGTAVTTTSTTTVNNVTTTTTTTTVNYTTNNGTNAGNVNQGEGSSSAPGDSSGSAGVGECGTAPTCSGDAIGCAQLAEAHLARCAAQDLGRTMTSSESTSLLGDDDSPANAEAAGVSEVITTSTADLDDAGFLTGGRSCPVVSAVTFYGVEVPFPYETICEWLSIGAFLIYIFAGLASLRIITGGVA